MGTLRNSACRRFPILDLPNQSSVRVSVANVVAATLKGEFGPISAKCGSEDLDCDAVNIQTTDTSSEYLVLPMMPMRRKLSCS